MRGVLGLLMVVLLFAVPVPALTVRAMDCALRPAFGGGNLAEEGGVGAFVEIAQAGEYTVEIKAYGSELDGEWSKMAVWIDNLPRERVVVDKKIFTPYAFKVKLSAHVHAIGAYFLNAAHSGGKTRNLYLDSITITPPDGAPEPALSAERAWANDGPLREQEVLEQTNDRIEQYRKGDATLALTGADGKPLADTEVTVELARHSFLFGCNLMAFQSFLTPELNKTYEDRFADLFNYATLPFYWYLYEAEKGKPNYAQTEAMLAWCDAHHIATKGHTLLWENKYGKPQWLAGKQADEPTQKARVDDLMGRYKGKIPFWEVVNEPVNQPGLSLMPAYAWARAADPAAKLGVNEYGILYIGHYKFLELMEKAVKDNVPFDFVGIQGHAPTTEAFPLDRVWAVLDIYAALKKDIHITEFTPASNGAKVTGATWRKIWTEDQQADYAEKFYRACFAHPNVQAISWWDFADQPGIFVQNGGLLHLDLTPKPAYLALKKLLHETWHTKITAKTDAQGRLPVRGYYGDYTVTAAGKKTATGTFTLAREAQAPVAVSLK